MVHAVFADSRVREPPCGPVRLTSAAASTSCQPGIGDARSLLERGDGANLCDGR